MISIDDLPIMGVGMELKTPADVLTFQMSMHQSYIWYDGIRSIARYADIKEDDHYHSLAKYRLDDRTMWHNMTRLERFYNGDK